MTPIRNIQSLLEWQLQGLGSPEVVSILAELIVAAVLFGGLAGSVSAVGWLLKRFARHATR